MATKAPARERHDGLSEERKQLFLTALRTGESVLDACALVGVSNRTVYNHRKRDPDFAEAWRLAAKMYRLPLEIAAFQRGVEGIEEPVYHHGRLIGTRRRYSDALLKMLLAGEKPRKYGRRAGLVADRKWLKKTIAAVIAPYKAELDAALAELAALKAEAAAPPLQIVNFVNPRPRRPKALALRPRREKSGLRPTAPAAPGRSGISPFPRPS